MYNYTDRNMTIADFAKIHDLIVMKALYKYPLSKRFYEKCKKKGNINKFIWYAQLSIDVSMGEEIEIEYYIDNLGCVIFDEVNQGG